MSLATTCSACGTVFRVVQDQLKVSEGWVRCGRCNEVFNALEGLFDLDRDTAPGSLGGELGEAVPTVKPPPAVAPSTAPPAPRDATRASAPPPVPPPLPKAPATPTPAAAPSKEPEQERQDPSLVDRFGHELFPERPGTRSGDRNSRFTAMEPPDFSGFRHDSELPADDDLPSRPLDSDQAFEDSTPPQHGSAGAPEFLRHAEQRERWNRPGVRLLLSLMSMGLLMLLGLQAMHHWRDTVAARWPAALPALAQWCSLVSCTIEPARRLDDIALESSGFTRLGTAGASPDQFRVSGVLRNRGTLALAMPWVELSLTDASGNLLVRKALSPQDFQAARVLEPARETPLQLALAAGTPLVTGYTVEMFYP